MRFPISDGFCRRACRTPSSGEGRCTKGSREGGTDGERELACDSDRPLSCVRAVMDPLSCSSRAESSETSIASDSILMEGTDDCLASFLGSEAVEKKPEPTFHTELNRPETVPKKPPDPDPFDVFVVLSC